MQNFFNKIDESFRNATKGKESVQNLIWWWGVVGYLVAYFIANKAVKIIDYRFVDIVISVLMVVYFSWHFYVLKKCSPKKIKLTKEEKEKLKIQNKQSLLKSLARKFLLQESITKWDPVFISMVVDVLCIATFLDYIF